VATQSIASVAGTVTTGLHANIHSPTNEDVAAFGGALRGWKPLEGMTPVEAAYTLPAEFGIKHLRQENELLKAENDYLKRREEILRK
jgi:hypothetical protein